MKAIRQHVLVGPEQLVYEDAPLPDPAAGEALLRVYAAGITPTELTWSEPLPTIPGHDVPGVVEASAPASRMSPRRRRLSPDRLPARRERRGVRRRAGRGPGPQATVARPCPRGRGPPLGAHRLAGAVHPRRPHGRAAGPDPRRGRRRRRVAAQLARWRGAHSQRDGLGTSPRRLRGVRPSFKLT